MRKGVLQSLPGFQPCSKKKRKGLEQSRGIGCNLNTSKTKKSKTNGVKLCMSVRNDSLARRIRGRSGPEEEGRVLEQRTIEEVRSDPVDYVRKRRLRRWHDSRTGGNAGPPTREEE